YAQVYLMFRSNLCSGHEKCAGVGVLRLLATGGTIASKAGDGGRVVGVEGTELLERARQVWPLETEVEVVDVAGLVSWALDTGQVLDLARQVSEHLAAADGVVITQGTDTMEE